MQEVSMKKIMAIGVTVALLAAAGSITAHHSLIQFDTSAPVRVKGTIVLFERISPHSRIVLEEKTENGQVQRWVVDGPAPNQLDRRGIGPDALKPGGAVEVCGFTLKPEVASGKANPQGRFMNGTLLVTPDGKRRLWSDYGHLKQCLDPGETRESLQ
jgi:hypothetical protein